MFYEGKAVVKRIISSGLVETNDDVKSVVHSPAAVAKIEKAKEHLAKIKNLHILER